MMMMYDLHSTPSPLFLPSSAEQRPHHRCLDGCHVDGADCCLIGIVLGEENITQYQWYNTTQYLQILPSTQ